MRLCCEVRVAYLQLMSESASKTVRATLAVGRKTNAKSKLVNDKVSEIFLTVTTAKDVTGRKYLVTGNLQQIFAKFWSQGKATIQFKDPAHQLCISKADPGELRKLLCILRLNPIEKKDTFDALPILDDVAQHVDPPKTRLTVNKQKNYPLRNGFPISLETLNVHDCSLTRIDARILDLRNLKFLDLARNRIKVLPLSMKNLTGLASLNLASNEIVEFPNSLCSVPLSKSLSSIDLSDNRMEKLPYYFGRLSGLVVLKLDRNKLRGLPQTFCQLTRLRQFSAINNQLPCLPPNSQRLKLDSMDLSGNPFVDEKSLRTIRNSLSVLTMKETCARLVKKSGLAYSPEVLPRELCTYLDLMKVCSVCGTSCTESLLHFVAPLNLGQISRTVVLSSGKRSVPVEGYFCSRGCFGRGQVNGHLVVL